MRLQLVLLGFLLVVQPIQSAYAFDNPKHIIDLSLEELLQVVVTSVSKKAQTLTQTPAAAYVIQAEEIRRSGASNIPEALRLAPGVQVAAIGNNKWAISIRGQADRFSNKLLVLVDGRSVYSPMFSGVIWEALDVPLENIERIEVIRGPGAAIWGANAVNGVINIITKSVFDTRGGRATLAAGSELRGYGFARYGWNPDPNTAIQIHAKAHDTDVSKLVSGGAGVDDWQNRSAGFKMEHLLGADRVNVQGGFYSSRAGDEIMMITAPAITPVRQTQRVSGGHLLGRWEGDRSATRQTSFQAYLEHSDYDHIILSELRTTLDLEYQQSWRPATNHDLTWGVGYRYSRDKVGKSRVVAPMQSESATSLFSGFLNDEITLQPEHWQLTLGLRLEHNDYTGFEFQPNARLLWTPDAQTSAWISVARAIHTPARIEHRATVYLPLSPFSALQMDNIHPREEKLNALDLGWRYQFSRALSADLAAFSYQYDNLRDAVIAGPPVVQPGGYVFIPTQNTNANTSTARGMEASVDWLPRSNWRLKAAYSFLDSKVRLAPDRLTSGYADTTPQHMFSLRSSLDLTPTLHWDAWLRHVGEVKAYAIPAYTTLDMRLAWQARKTLQISLIGQNLLDSSHPEFGSVYILSQPTQTQRGFYVMADWKF